MKRPHAPRGYVLMVVVVLGIVLASLAAILIYATGRDRAEGKLQQSSVRSVYAAEAAVAVGVEHLRELLEEKVAPTATDLKDVEVQTRATLGASMSNATFPVLSVKYYSPLTNTVFDEPVAANNTLVTITDGPNRGLRAQQTPIQVLATARVDNASASVADAIRVDLIPVFQFAIFFDGDLEAQRPARMSVAGRVHTNGNLYLSNGNRVDFLNTVTAAGKVHSHGAASTGLTVGSGASGTYFRRLSDGAQTEIARNLPLKDADQKTYLEKTYGIGGGLQDATTGAQPLSIPLRLSGATPCASDAACGVGRSCVKVRVTDDAGVCTGNVTSRPNVCADGKTRAEFAQSLAIELVRRPSVDYSSSGIPCIRPGEPAGCRPYALPYLRDDVEETSPYAADFGVRPDLRETANTPGADTAKASRQPDGSGADPDDVIELFVPNRVPIVTSAITDDDPGAVVDRLYWKAHIRIIDGIWYRGQSTVPVFNPEQDAPGTANPDPITDLDHAFARVLRYAWWWDVRENRVYCESATADSNCVTNGNEYHRGAQIRATDFDVAAFLALLERGDARAALFPDGAVPEGGVIVYLSETYDPKYEDANSPVVRGANVRNFLNFPIMHNHLTPADINGGHASLTGLVRRDPVAAFEGTDAAPPRCGGLKCAATPHELGWFPENIWGRNVSGISMESLTRPSAADPTAVADFYADPPMPSDPAPTSSKNGSTCAIPGTDITSSRRPPSRPKTFPSDSPPPPCTQAGAQPLGPENAVRVIRAHTMPEQGFTLVTDNRLYLHGDVNTRGDSKVISGGFETSQDLSGKIAFIADSLTIMSERFDERTHQASGGTANFHSFFRSPESYAGETFATARGSLAEKVRALPWSRTANGGVDDDGGAIDAAETDGGAPANICKVVFDAQPFETRINASLLMGDVPACKDAGDTMGNNSGGVNNFPRFVERWEGINLMLNGSMVGLFRSERGNARFLNAETNAGGTVRQARSGSAYASMGSADVCDYRPPTRQWTFDETLLQSIGNLPPGTPRVVATDRLRWVRR